MLPEYLSSAQEQKNRYLNHNNFLEDAGYVGFLLDFLFSVFNFPTIQRKFLNADVNVITDYGSGPNPVMIKLLKIFSRIFNNEGKCAGVAEGLLKKIVSDKRFVPFEFFPNVDNIWGWDLFFDNEKKLLLEKSDLVLCLEVAEHFEEPAEGFSALSKLCAENGFVAVGTSPVKKDVESPDGFSSWWYKDDITHVSFYTEVAAELCGSRAGLDYVGMASDRVFIFQKP